VIVVADAGPLIHLSAAGQFDLLRELYDRVVVPREVYDEVVVKGRGLPGSAELAAATWIELSEPRTESLLFRILREDLDPGESAALAVAMERKADLVLLDDRKGRIAAERLGLVVRGTVGIFLEAKRKGRMERIGPLLEMLRESGIWLSDAVIETALRQAGEWSGTAEKKP
jgi:uncharacterized protein